MQSFEQRLDRLAEVAVKVGVRIRPGQELVMTAPVEALPLARQITERAYKAGASLVTTLFSDDAMTLLRFQNAPDESFDKATGWLFDGMAAAFRSGAARLAIVGEDPSLLSAQDTQKVARANRARSAAYRPALEYIVNFDVNWSIVSFATPAWARAVFPDLAEGEAVGDLWEAIFASSRVDRSDPIAEWQRHNATLNARTRYLNDRRFAALRFRGPGTDLTVGLADDHLWEGGASIAKNGITCNANIPTEEVFTTPHRLRVDGIVRSTKPLSYQGTLIEDISVRFAGGRIAEARSRTGTDVLTEGAVDRRGRLASRRGRAGAELLADLDQRHPLLQHAVRRERRQPYRTRPGLFEMHPRWRDVVETAARGAWRQCQPDPYRLDDRLRPDRCRRHWPKRHRRAADAQGRVGIGRFATSVEAVT